MNDIDTIWEKVSRHSPPLTQVMIPDLRTFLACCDNPHACILSGRDCQETPGLKSARALELLVIEQHGRRLHSKRDVADWLILLYIAQREVRHSGVALSTTRLAVIPTPQSSPFNPSSMQASQRVTLWRHALGQWVHSDPSDKSRDEWQAAVAISAVLYGALLDVAKVKRLIEILNGRMALKEAAGFAFVEFDMPFRGMGNHHLQRWFVDPYSELLMLRLPASETTHPSRNLAAGIKKFFLSQGVEKDKCPTGLGDLISSSSTWWSCRAAQIDLHAITRTFSAHSIHPRTMQRIYGYQADQRRPGNGGVNNDGNGDADVVEDVHILHPWLPESLSPLDVSSLEVSREDIEQMFARQPDDAMEKVYLGWLRFMLSGNSASKAALSLSTIRKRYSEAATRLLAMLGDADPRQMDTESLEDCYAELVLEQHPDQPVGDLAKGLLDFHAYLVSAHGKKHITKPSQVFGDAASLMPVDANLVSFDDYLSAQSWLDARLADGRDPDEIIICKLVMAMAFKLGMRRMEILGLRLEDIQVTGLVCLVRPHPGRRLKTTSSKRLIPVGALFDWRERKLLKRWFARRSVEEARESLPPGSVRSQYLFARVDRRRAEKRVSVDGVVGRICEALRAVTGDPRIFLHHLRHSFGTWAYLRLLAPDYPLVADFFIHLPETGKAIRQGRRLRLQLLGARGGPSRAYAHAVARLLGHSSPQVSMGHYIHSSDMILAAITHREMADVPRSELVAASGLPMATVYRHLAESEHHLVMAARERHHPEKAAGSQQANSDNSPKAKRGRPNKTPAHERPEWLALAKVRSILHLAGMGGFAAGEIARQLGLGVGRVESILLQARLLGPLIGLSTGDDGEAPCPDKPRYSGEKMLAQDLEERLASMALRSPRLHAEGMELHLRHFNRSQRDVVFKGVKDITALRQYLKFLRCLGFDFNRLQWVVRLLPEDIPPSPPLWVGGVSAPAVPARVKRIAPPSVAKASSYAQWAGLQVIDENGYGLGQAMAGVIFLAMVAVEEL